MNISSVQVPHTLTWPSKIHLSIVLLSIAQLGVIFWKLPIPRCLQILVFLLFSLCSWSPGLRLVSTVVCENEGDVSASVAPVVMCDIPLVWASCLLYAFFTSASFTFLTRPTVQLPHLIEGDYIMKSWCALVHNSCPLTDTTCFG